MIYPGIVDSSLARRSAAKASRPPQALLRRRCGPSGVGDDGSRDAVTPAVSLRPCERTYMAARVMQGMQSPGGPAGGPGNTDGEPLTRTSGHCARKSDLDNLPASSK